MTEENAIATTPDLTTLTLPESSLARYEEQDAAGLVGGTFLPRLQVCGSNTEAVKMGLVPVGVWGVVQGDKCIDLGKEIDVLMVAWRPQAIKIDKSGGTSKVFSFFQRDSIGFKKVMADSAVDNRNNLWGVQLLVWLPMKRLFAGFFLCSDSSRNEAPNYLGLMSKAGEEQGCKFGMAKATFKLKLLKNAKGSWHNGYPDPCTTPLETMPDQASLTEAVNTFMNPSSSVIPESAPAESRAR